MWKVLINSRLRARRFLAFPGTIPSLQASFMWSDRLRRLPDLTRDEALRFQPLPRLRGDQFPILRTKAPAILLAEDFREILIPHSSFEAAYCEGAAKVM